MLRKPSSQRPVSQGMSALIRGSPISMRLPEKTLPGPSGYPPEGRGHPSSTRHGASIPRHGQENRPSFEIRFDLGSFPQNRPNSLFAEQGELVGPVW